MSPLEVAEARYKAAGLELGAARDEMVACRRAGLDVAYLDRRNSALREVLASQLALMKIGLGA